MADDITISPIGTPYPVVTDELAGGRHVQIMKAGFGANGLLTMVEDAAPLPVASRLTLPAAARLSMGPFAIGAAGVSAVIVGTPGQTIRVFRMFLVSSGDVAVALADGSTLVHPAIPLLAYGAWVLDFDGEPWLVTTPGNSFGLSLSVATATVQGAVYYTKG